MAKSRVQVSLCFFPPLFYSLPHACFPQVGYIRCISPFRSRRGSLLSSSRASVIFLFPKCRGAGKGIALALPNRSSPFCLSLGCRFRSGERHGQSSRVRLSGEAESPLEKLQVDSGPGAEEGLPQTVPLRWTDFQHACESVPPLTRRNGHNSNRVADLHDWFQSGRVAGGRPRASSKCVLE